MVENLLQCSNCKTVNGIPRALSSNVHCGKCNKILIAIPRAKSGMGGRLFLLGALMGGFGAMYVMSRNATEPKVSMPTQSMPSGKLTKIKPAAAADDWRDLGEVVQLPGAGVLQRPNSGIFNSDKSIEFVAPFKVSVSNNADYFVVLTDSENRTVKSFYLRAGSSIESLAPLGTFFLLYAAGKDWFGEELLFGKDTLFSNTRKEFKFFQDGTGYNGVAVELILQSNGNLPTEQITREEFLKRTGG